MFYYLGKRVEIDEQLRKARNTLNLWSYGYNADIDTVIISKDGTLGSVWEVMGLKIGLPEAPADDKVLNYGLPTHKQVWKRQLLPEGMSSDNWTLPKFFPFIEEQFYYREHGRWMYCRNELVYLAPSYWFFLQNYREESDFPRFRIIQNELMLFWEACKADFRCYGMDYVKNRRFGASALGNSELLNLGTIHENKELGIVSKKGTDARKIFARLVRSFKRLSPYFKPETDGNTTPKTELVFTEQSRKRKIGEKVRESIGLETTIKWHNTEINAMDGDRIFLSLLDEAGKYPKEVPFDQYWNIVKTSHRIGSSIVGKAMVVSTVNAMKKGGKEFLNIWKDSDVNQRNNNGQTKSGLYRIFIPAKYSLEGFFDVYGFSIVDDPKKPTKNDVGNMVDIGAVSFLRNELEGLKDDPEGQNEFLRQFPDSERDAFRDEATDCDFNLMV